MRMLIALLNPKYILCVAWLLTIGTTLVSQPARESFSESISTSEPTVKSGSSVRIEVTITNNLSKVLFVVSSRIGPQAAGVSIWDDNGNLLQPKERFKGKADTMHRGIGLGIGPGKSETEPVDLSKWFDLTKPGQYTVQTRRRNDTGGGLVVESNKLTITVVP